MKLAKNRGFKSNRKEPIDEVSKEPNGDKLSQLDKQLHLAKESSDNNCRTITEYQIKFCNGRTSFRPGESKFYPTREMREREFDLICEKQSEFYKDIDFAALKEIVFFQRPLRPQKRGNCTFIDGEPRTWKDMPCSERQKILQDVKYLRYQDANGKWVPIEIDQAKKAIEVLKSCKEVAFSKLKKIIGMTEDTLLNFEQGRTKLKGCPTATEMANKKNFGSKWWEMSLEEQDNIIEVLHKSDIEDSEIERMLEKYELSDEQVQNILKFATRSATSSSCRKVLEGIVTTTEEVLAKQDILLAYDEAICRLGYKPIINEITKSDHLLPYEEVRALQSRLVDGKIQDVTSHTMVNAVRKLTNAFIDVYGLPNEICIETVRTLKQTEISKKDCLNKIKENEAQRESIKKELAKIGLTNPSNSDILKYSLWKEANEQCIYCGKKISINELFSNKIQIEHILPLADTLDDNRNNKTISCDTCNQNKGKRSPFDAFGNNPSGYKYSEIVARAACLPSKKRVRFNENALDTYLSGEKFLASQLNSTANIASFLSMYMKTICDNVFVTRGGITATIRKTYGLDSILSVPDANGKYTKNRSDIRHNALDAIVIGMTSKGLIRQIQTLSRKNKLNTLQPPPCPIPVQDIEKVLKNMIPYFKPDHGPQKAISNETLYTKRIVDGKEVYGCKKDIDSIENEKDIENLISAPIRDKIKDLMSKGLPIREAVAEIKKDGIRHPFFKYRNEPTVILPPNKKCKFTRYYDNDTYAAAELWCLPDKDGKNTYKLNCLLPNKYNGNSGKLRNAQAKPDFTKPYSNAYKIRGVAPDSTIHKGDYIEYDDELGGRTIARIAVLCQSSNKIRVLPIYTTCSPKEWASHTNPNLVDDYWKDCQLNGPKELSVQKLFNELNATFIRVDILGNVSKVSAKKHYNKK